jgi:hypothetical protein
VQPLAQVQQSATSLMSNSLPSYDLQRLFRAPEILQVLSLIKFYVHVGGILRG